MKEGSPFTLIIRSFVNKLTEDTFSSSSSSSSSSDSESESENEGDVPLEAMGEDGDDCEEGGAVATTVSLRTKNELLEPVILVPPIAQVGPEEQLEKVGEIMAIVNNVVIVKGEASATRRTSGRALDSETLLMYEDRKVLGYVSTLLSYDSS
jgi:H/ACA ribonucleoprotein complex non-core subunit NAF1